MQDIELGDVKFRQRPNSNTYYTPQWTIMYFTVNINFTSLRNVTHWLMEMKYQLSTLFTLGDILRDQERSNEVHDSKQLYEIDICFDSCDVNLIVLVTQLLTYKKYRTICLGWIRAVMLEVTLTSTSTKKTQLAIVIC